MTSTAATHTGPVGPSPTPDQLVTTWRERIKQARDARKPHEPTFLSNLAFAAGQHWLVWDTQRREMRHIADMDPRYAERELYTADRITEQRAAALGELESDDDRPELLIAQNSDSAEQVAREINAAVAYGWDHEWRADQALKQARRLCVDLGVSAVRCRFDPTLGPVVANVPTHQGKPLVDPADAYRLIDQGVQLDFQDIHEGRTVWEPLSAFNLLTPPGVPHEDNFPWEVVVRPVLIDTVVEEYGDVAQGLTEDSDIGSVIGMSTSQQTRTGDPSANRGRLRGHVWLFTCFTRPCRSYPSGQVAVFASNQMRLLHTDNQLPYRRPDGSWATGLHYFHFWRLNDRFHSRAFIEGLKDPQRLINRRETQNAEIIDRGMPKVFTKEGALVHDPSGLPLENIELADVSLEPHFFAGIGPGAWMYEDIAHHADNLSHASTLSALKLGENPPGIKTYSQLALLNEQESTKRSPILQEHMQSIAGLVEDSVWDIRRYWPAEKTILVSGDDDRIGQQAFAKSKIPDFFMVKVAKGSVQPRSQAAEISKIDAIWSAAAPAFGADPRWVKWYVDSLNAGIAQELPEVLQDSQTQYAQYENMLMLHQGETPQPAEYDLAPVHVPIHREAQDQARAAGDMEAFDRIQQHIDASIQMATMARKAWRIPDPADTQDMASDVALDEDQALRENEMMVAGVPLNPEEMQKALASLQAGTNPETGQPVNPQTDDLHQILLRASLKPTLVENLQMHLDRHGKVIKSEEFKSFPPDMRQRFLTHFDQTRDLYLSLPTMPEKVDAPKVTLNLRESVGASTIADVLRRAGVPEADPQTIATEPPLENMVSRTDPAPANDPQIIDRGPRPPL